MRLEAATLALEPRTVGECVDLAIRFYRRHLGALLTLTFLFAAFPVGLSMLATDSGAGWIVAIASFVFLSPFLGSAIVAGAGHRVFGESFEIRRALSSVRSRMGTLVLVLPLIRSLVAGISFLCWGVLSVPVATRYGFLSEVVLLEQQRGLRVARRCEEIVRSAFLETCGRYAALAGFAALVGTVLFVLVDASSQALLGAPIFLGRISWAVAMDDVFNLVAYDAMVVGLAALSAWLVYPIVRLAWFFCYLDSRVRAEAWDVEIAFRVEAKRLDHAR